VGRLAAVKDQPTLARAFCALIKRAPQCRQYVRLAIVGDGPLREECLRILRGADAEKLAWLPGTRNDIAVLMRGFDVFVLPSRAEGMSNTVLEAMATGLQVVATAVGGNTELVEDGVTGRLVPSGDEHAMADALHLYVTRPDERTRHGHNGLRRIDAEFRIEKMVSAYEGMYDTLLSLNERRHSRIARFGAAWTRVRP
jgi:glycosyltransferase involved in cell wall biosynthesis